MDLICLIVDFVMTCIFNLGDSFAFNLKLIVNNTGLKIFLMTIGTMVAALAFAFIATGRLGSDKMDMLRRCIGYATGAVAFLILAAPTASLFL